ncbi:hypothetical protein F0U62_41245 [Cystobacter fuscus]|uniref:hypothetical protein n=1 Tax=Cystobacter fuscus TaxID=43 RepID=UPI002B2FB88E|nr:hypothetical protein F0U62_41245 [Cystobacter fuscus]
MSYLRTFRVSLAGMGALVGSAAAAACLPPTGAPGPAFNQALARYRDCTIAESREAQVDPLKAMRDRAAVDRFHNGLISLGKYAIDKLLPYGDLVSFVDIRLASSLYTKEVKAGVRNKFDAYKTEFAGFTALVSPSTAQAGSVVRAWRELRAELQKMRETTNVPEEQSLLDQKLREGDVMNEGVAMIALLKSTNAQSAEVKAFLRSQLRATEANLGAKIDERMKEIVAIVQSGRPGQGERNAKLIGEYALFSQSMIGLGVRAGILPAGDAHVMTQVVAGVSQIATAAALLQDSSTYVSVVGPYGMAIGGALVLASAFDKQEKSESLQIMAMLKQISKQIAALQFSVEQGFSGLSTQISETEVRIMGKFSELLQANEIVLVKLDAYSQDVRTLRDDLMRARRADQLAANAAFIQKVIYYDEACLKDFNVFQTAKRDACVATYAGLVHEFTTTENQRLIGTAYSLDEYAGYEEQTAKLLGEYNSLADVPLSVTPAHRPTLDMIARRFRLLVAYNPELRTKDVARNVEARIARFEEGNKQLSAALSSPAFVAKLNGLYRQELDAVLAAVDKKAASYASGKIVTVADEINQREVAVQNEPFAMSKMAAAFTGGSYLYTLYSGQSDNIGWLDTADAPAAFLGRNAHVREKLANYAAAASSKDPISRAIFPKRLGGNVWVSPCNAQSGYPQIAVSRKRLAETVPASLVALTSIGKSGFSICYEPSTVRTNDNIGIGNTNEGMGTVNSRLQEMGMVYNTWPPFQNSFCFMAPQHFGVHYSSYPEYARSDWEECHHGHIHHELFVHTEQVYSIRFVASLNLVAYRAPTASFSETVAYTNDQLNKCFLPFDNRKASNKAAILMPFRQLYPLPIRSSCPGADDQLIAVLPRLGSALASFLKDNKTRRLVDGSPEITYEQALEETLAEQAERHYLDYVRAVFADGVSTARLDRLSLLLRATRYFGGLSVDPAGPTPMNSQELQDYLVLQLIDREKQALRTASVLNPMD